MLAAERGAARNTLAAYQADLQDFAAFTTAKGVALHGADSALLRAWLAGLAAQGLARRFVATVPVKVVMDAPCSVILVKQALPFDQLALPPETA